MERIGRGECRRIRDALQRTLDNSGLASELGVSITVGNASYDYKTATLKVEFASIDSEGNVHDSEQQKFVEYNFAHQLGEDAYGKVFTVRGIGYAICGYRPKASKRPISGRRISDDKTFCFPLDTVKRALATTDG